MSEAAHLRRIRDKLAAIAPAEWSLAADDLGLFVEASDKDGAPVALVRAQPGVSSEEIEFMADAPRNMAFLLAIFDRAIAAMRERSGQSGRQGAGEPSATAQDTPRNYAAEAAMKCQEPAFKAFLEARHGLERPLTDDRVAQKLRSLLGIATRKTLNTDDAAASRWKRLREEFNAWRTAG
ncbi:hypothetical protein [Nitratireductor luteus]|uniref:hypothetical protein n=1 Tax=Nitratireductor luteus TaxID=2976980 RepID=UPI00223F6AF5|nr:hypothetical protein [Nitratireductor luteus]